MSAPVVDIDGVSIHCVSRESLIDCFRSSLLSMNEGVDSVYVGMYASLFFRSRIRGSYRNLLKQAEFIYPDGAPVAWLARFLSTTNVERCATTDVWADLVDVARDCRVPVVLIGSSDDSVAAMAEAVSARGASVSMYRNGYWKSESQRQVVEGVRSTGPALVFIGLGAERQESFAQSCVLANADSRYSGQVFFTVGGLFDHVAGATPRAPQFIQQAGFEWLWRSWHEPRRLLMRYLVGNTYFVLVALLACARVFIGRSPMIEYSGAVRG